MSYYYKCYFCEDFKSNRKSNILSHLNKNKKCIRSSKSYMYTNEELLNKSCEKIYLKYITPPQKKENSEQFKTLDTSNELKNTIYVEPSNITIIKEEEKLNQCMHCLKILSNKYNLNIHYKTCKLLNNEKETTVNNNVTNTNSGDSSIVNSGDNATLNVNSNNININIITPISFEQNWDVSEIDTSKKTQILVSNIMYTSLLNKILENEKNQNIVIENDTNSGLVYMNEKDKYITMKIDDIFEKTMEKLHKQLIEITTEFRNDNDDNFSLDSLNSFLTVANRKIVNYRQNIDIKEGTNNFIKQIFNNIKGDAINIMNGVNKEET